MTVQNALREVGLIVSRECSGVFVRERAERALSRGRTSARAFEAQHVTVDLVRGLVPDPVQSWTLPVAVDDRTDSPAFRKRAEEIIRRNTLAIVDSVAELADLGLINGASAEIRVRKINDEEA